MIPDACPCKSVALVSASFSTPGSHGRIRCVIPGNARLRRDWTMPLLPSREAGSEDPPADPAAYWASPSQADGSFTSALSEAVHPAWWSGVLGSRSTTQHPVD